MEEHSWHSKMEWRTFFLEEEKLNVNDRNMNFTGWANDFSAEISQRTDWCNKYLPMSCSSWLKKKKKGSKIAKCLAHGMNIWLAKICVDFGLYNSAHGHRPEGKHPQKNSQWTLHTHSTLCLIIFISVSSIIFISVS